MEPKLFEGRIYRWKHFYSRTLRTLPGQWDVAAAYLEGEPIYYVADFVNAGKKLCWIHNDYQSLPLDPQYDALMFREMDKIVTISTTCLEVLQETFPEFTEKMRLIENISFEQSIEYLEKRFPGKGAEYAQKLKDCTIALYKKCADYALSKGIIIADTKFEFGLDEDGNIVIGDEMLTPDSSRFWPLDGYEAGHSQPSFDKQFARDWLKANEGHNWTLPQEIVDKTIEKYLEGYRRLTGKELQ